MTSLTRTEEETMRLFWENGAMSVRELQGWYDDPKPHFRTLSTAVRILEEKGFLAYEAVGDGVRYYPVVEEDRYRRGALSDVVDRWFGRSGIGAVAALVDDERLSLEDLKGFIGDKED